MHDTNDPTAVLTEKAPPPLPTPPLSGKRVAFEYLTVRELLVAHALQGVLAAHAGDEIGMPKAAEAAAMARKYGDALLAELHATPFPG